MRQLNFIFAMGLIASVVMMPVGCRRSPQYAKEQQYYRTAGEGPAQQGLAAIQKAEKLMPKKRVYVLPFENVSAFDKAPGAAGGPEDLGLFTSEELMRELRLSGHVVIPEDLRTPAHSRDFFSGDKIRAGALAREGRRLGVSMVIVGRIKKVVYRQKGEELGILRKRNSVAAAQLEMRLFDATQGREIFADEKSGDSSAARMNIFGGQEAANDSSDARVDLVHEAIHNAVVSLTRNIGLAIEKISWEGRVAKITGNNIYVNAGRTSGLTIGDILKVIAPGDEIYDPVTGVYLGRGLGQVKGTLEVIDYLGNDGTITKIHSGGGFTENDVVQLY